MNKIGGSIFKKFQNLTSLFFLIVVFFNPPSSKVLIQGNLSGMFLVLNAYGKVFLTLGNYLLLFFIKIILAIAGEEKQNNLKWPNYYLQLFID